MEILKNCKISDLYSCKLDINQHSVSTKLKEFKKLLLITPNNEELQHQIKELEKINENPESKNAIFLKKYKKYKTKYNKIKKNLLNKI
jgi:hypothetical protein